MVSSIKPIVFDDKTNTRFRQHVCIRILFLLVCMRDIVMFTPVHIVLIHCLLMIQSSNGFGVIIFVAVV